MKRLEKKVALITGAEGGIGRAIVELFAQHGAIVVGVDLIDQPQPDSPFITTDSAHYFPMDITNSQDIAQGVAAVIAEFGRIDILVNAAGIIGSGKNSLEISEQEFDRIFAINVRGSWLVTKHVAPQMMKQQSGSIIHFSSISGLVATSSAQSVYSMTKGAVRLMAKNDALLLAPDNIRVNSIHPGSIETEMSIQTIKNSPEGEEYNKRLVAKHPLGRRGTAQEIAQAVLFLASEESSFMTGSELVVDGGYTAQ